MAGTKTAHLHYLMYKPVGVVSSRCDSTPPKVEHTKSTRTTVYDLAASNGFPTDCGLVGRLDTKTSGLVLFTSDPFLNRALAHPCDDDTYDNALKIKKYLVTIFGQRSDLMVHETEPRCDNICGCSSNGTIPQQDQSISEQSDQIESQDCCSCLRDVSDVCEHGKHPRLLGLKLKANVLETELKAPLNFHRGGRALSAKEPVSLKLIKCWREPYQQHQHGDFSALVSIELNEGKHHQIRRLVHRSRLKVRHLHRVSIAGLLSCNDMNPGDVRWLEPGEINALYKLAESLPGHQLKFSS